MFDEKSFCEATSGTPGVALPGQLFAVEPVTAKELEQLLRVAKKLRSACCGGNSSAEDYQS
jgi:hypothetical protein